MVAELSSRSSIPAMFGKGPARYEPLELAPNLFAAHVQPDPALHEYAMRKLRFEALFSLVFENDAVRRFLEVIPGMNELLLLGKAFDLERETSDGRPTWDTVVVDAPATGHGISLLRLPQVILEVVEQAARVGHLEAPRPRRPGERETRQPGVDLARRRAVGAHSHPDRRQKE